MSLAGPGSESSPYLYIQVITLSEWGQGLDLSHRIPHPALQPHAALQRGAVDQIKAKDNDTRVTYLEVS